MRSPSSFLDGILHTKQLSLGEGRLIGLGFLEEEEEKKEEEEAVDLIKGVLG